MPFIFHICFCVQEVDSQDTVKHLLTRPFALRNDEEGRDTIGDTIHRKNVKNNCQTRSRPIRAFVLRSLCSSWKKQLRFKYFARFFSHWIHRQTVIFILLLLFLSNFYFFRMPVTNRCIKRYFWILHYILAFEPTMITARAFIVCGPGQRRI